MNSKMTKNPPMRKTKMMLHLRSVYLPIQFTGLVRPKLIVVRSDFPVLIRFDSLHTDVCPPYNKRFSLRLSLSHCVICDPTNLCIGKTSERKGRFHKGTIYKSIMCRRTLILSSISSSDKIAGTLCVRGRKYGDIS